MKKDYIQPSIEVNAVKAMQNMLDGSTPFKTGEGDGGAEGTVPIMAPKRRAGAGEVF